MSGKKTATAETVEVTEVQQQVETVPTVEADTTPATTQTPGANGGQPVARVFSQSELDTIIAQRLEQERRKYADYPTLLQKVQAFEATQGQQQQQSAERLQQLEAQNQQLASTSKEKAIEAAIAKAAAPLGLDPDAALKLADLGALTVDDAGNVTNADAVVKSVAERFPGLLKRPMPQASAVNPPASAIVPERTDAHRRAEYFGGHGGAFWNSGGVRLPE